jgi:phosphoserine phosphatase
VEGGEDAMTSPAERFAELDPTMLAGLHPAASALAAQELSVPRLKQLVDESVLLQVETRRLARCGSGGRSSSRIGLTDIPEHGVGPGRHHGIALPAAPLPNYPGAAMLTSPSPPSAATAAGWAPLAWSSAEGTNFSFFRDRSNEPTVLTAAIDAHCRRFGLDPAVATAIDVGSADGEFSRRLDGLFGTYLPVPFQGHDDVTRFVAHMERRSEGELLRFDVSILAHVLPYLRDPNQLLSSLARHSNGHGIGMAVLLAPSGDQYRVGRLALEYDRRSRRHDHAARFAAWLGARSVGFETHTVVSEAVAEDQAALLRLLAFFSGSSDEQLLERIAKELEPAVGGGYRLTSEHQLITWRLHDLLPQRMATSHDSNGQRHRTGGRSPLAPAWRNGAGKDTATVTTVVGFDLNKTLIRENSWYDFNIAMGISPGEDEFLYRLGPEGEGILTYEEWIDILVRLVRKRGRVTHSAMEHVLLNFDYLEGGKEVVANLKQRGYAVGVMSGARSLIVARVVQDLNLDFAVSNAHLIFDQINILQNIRLQGADLELKVNMIRDLKKTYGDAADIYYVAEGDNDEAVFRVTSGIVIDIGSSAHESWKQHVLEERRGSPLLLRGHRLGRSSRT